MSIDLDRVKQDADLLTLASHDTELKKVAATNGGEYAGPCPFCGGDDRFHVQPLANPGRWLCHYCSPKWDTVIGYIAKRDNLDPKNHNDLAEICQRAVGNLPTTSSPRPDPSPEPAYQPPADDWQAAARQIIDNCKANLWSEAGQKGLEYLKQRGLTEKTIDKFTLGYSAGFEHAGLWVPRGILIPCVVASEIWYLKIRIPLTKKDIEAKKKKYTCVKGSRPAAIYNADQLDGADVALFCEGEFDCVIAHQELNDVLPCVTLGSATNRPDLATWGPYLLPLKMILSAYDMDKAGESGAAMLADLAGERVKLAPLPPGPKDINEYHQAGGDLWAWIKPLLEFYDPVEV